MTNLCDLWLFTRAVGWILVQSCERDAPFFEANTVAGLFAPQTAHEEWPEVSILASTWSNQGVVAGIGALWMYGGVSHCDRVPPDEREGLNLTVCDINWDTQTLFQGAEGAKGSDIDTLGGQCSDELWRFSLGSWTRVQPPPGSISAETWPGALCGAASAVVLPADAGQSTATATAVLVGGWAGTVGGVCGTADGPTANCSSMDGQSWRLDPVK